jgi:hypothetical protein
MKDRHTPQRRTRQASGRAGGQQEQEYERLMLTLGDLATACKDSFLETSCGVGGAATESVDIV